MMAAKCPALLPGATVHQRRAVRLGIGERIGCFSVHRALEASDVGSHVLDAASIAVSRDGLDRRRDAAPHSERWRAREAANLFMVRPPRQALYFKCCRNAETVISLRKIGLSARPTDFARRGRGGSLR
jgi:hypothetical protein